MLAWSPDGNRLSLLGLRARRTETGDKADRGEPRTPQQPPARPPAKARATAGRARPPVRSGPDRTLRPRAPRRRQERSPAPRAQPSRWPPPRRGQTFPKPIPALGDRLCRASPSPGPSAPSVHFAGEMSGLRRRGKEGGRQEGPRLGKKPAPAADDGSPGECAARPGSASLLSFFPPPPQRMPSPLPRLPARPAHQRLALLPGVRRAGDARPSLESRPYLGAEPHPGVRAPRARGKGGSWAAREDPDAPRSPGTAFTQRLRAEPQREPDLACRSGGRGARWSRSAALCTGPACPLARAGARVSPSERLARKKGVLWRRPRERSRSGVFSRLREGVQGRVCTDVHRRQPGSTGVQISGKILEINEADQTRPSARTRSPLPKRSQTFGFAVLFLVTSSVNTVNFMFPRDAHKASST